jgi:hypothetical protein
MNTLIRMFAKYYVQYDPVTKILFIKKDIPVIDFMGIKHLLKYINEEVKDIRVN